MIKTKKKITIMPIIKVKVSIVWFGLGQTAGFSGRPSNLVQLLFHWPSCSTLVSFSGKTSTCGSPSLSGGFCTRMNLHAVISFEVES